MLLQRLNEYEHRLEQDATDPASATPNDYTPQTIPWVVDLDLKGQLCGIVRTSSGASTKDKGKRFPAPYLRRSGTKVKPQLLADKAEFVLGFPGDDQQRAKSRHRDFFALIAACSEETKEPTVHAVLRFLEKMDLRHLTLPDDLSPVDFITFRVGGTFPINLSSVQDFWRRVAPYLGARGIEGLTPDLIRSWLKTDKPSGQDQNWECIVCGKKCQPARVHPIAIKLPRAVADQQCSIVTANKDAFLSYGLEQSLIAPTCRLCAGGYAKAVNRLIQEDNSHITIGPLVYLFWTKEERGFSIATLLSKPEPNDVQALIESAFSGRRAGTKLDATPFYATALSASGGRVVVRDWIDTTIESVQYNLARYFSLQNIVERDGAKGNPYGLYALAASTVRDAKQDLSPHVPKVLLHMALRGGPLPLSLLSQTVRRNRAEGDVTRNRAALIKMVLQSQQNEISQEEVMVSLDAEHTEPAYLCGRLLAVLESVQHAAIPNAGSTITDRFYGTASSAPAAVFGKLIKGSQAHLGKLRKEKRGAYEALEQRLEDIQKSLHSFPKVLTLEQQGMFSLGYYHQRAADRAAAIANKKAKEEKQ